MIKPMPLLKRLEQMQAQHGDHACWLWPGHCQLSGYAQAANGMAHRRAYELLVGPIPRGCHLHHICGRKPCINPGHLQILTPRQHTAERFAKQTHCKRGHPLSGDNLVAKGTHRTCKTCRLLMERIRRAAMPRAEKQAKWRAAYYARLEHYRQYAREWQRKKREQAAQGADERH